MQSHLKATVFDQGALNAVKAGYPILGAIAGGLAYYNLSEAIANSGMAISNSSWNVLSSICGTIIGYFYWGEALTPKHFAGTVLGCASLYLMNDS